MQEHAESLDGIIDTVSAQHEIAAEVALLKIDGKLIFVGVPAKVTFLPYLVYKISGKQYWSLHANLPARIAKRLL